MVVPVLRFRRCATSCKPAESLQSDGTNGYQAGNASGFAGFDEGESAFEPEKGQFESLVGQGCEADAEQETEKNFGQQSLVGGVENGQRGGSNQEFGCPKCYKVKDVKAVGDAAEPHERVEGTRDVRVEEGEEEQRRSCGQA